MHLKPKYANVKEEILYNPYYDLSKDNWNQTLRKATVFYNSFASKRIQTADNGRYDDKVTNTTAEWKKGESISLMEVVILKLYTDFDKLQFELKKSFRFETISDIFTLNNFGNCNAYNRNLQNTNEKITRQLLKKRLCIFYWWRIHLLTVLSKYSNKINSETSLYHGVNAKMILNTNRSGIAFYGPLSTSSSYNVARTFATAKGTLISF